MIKRGQFLVLDGGEGVGKTSNLAFIRQILEENSIDYIVTREPGGTEIAEQIRTLILQKQEETMAPMAELLLMFAARAQHIEEKIKPALVQGIWVLCDRFTDATYAYQGGGRALNKAHIEQLEQLVQGDLRPDCVLLLDAPVEVGHARARARAELDRMESEDLSFHQRVREAYLERANKDSTRYCIIDASQPLVDVQQAIKRALLQRIKP